MIDPPAETPKEGFTPITIGVCTTAKSAVNILFASEQASVQLSVSATDLGSFCAGILHDRIEEVKNDDIDASAGMPSAQQKTSGDASNPLPMIVTSDELKRYPKLGETVSNTAPVDMEIAASTVEEV